MARPNPADQLKKELRQAGVSLTTWSGSPCPLDPDNYWIDDETNERVNAYTGERTPIGGTP